MEDICMSFMIVLTTTIPRHGTMEDILYSRIYEILVSSLHKKSTYLYIGYGLIGICP